MTNWTTCKWCGNAFRKKTGLDKHGHGRKIWKMLLGFPLYCLLGGLGKNEIDAAAFGGETSGIKDNNIFFHAKYCGQQCYLAAKEQADAKAAEKARKKAEKEQKKAEKKAKKESE